MNHAQSPPDAQPGAAQAAFQLNLRHLRGLTAVHEHGSISAAAGAVGLSQPALTQGILKLEKLMGEVLFERRPDGIVPTAAGELVVDRARACLAHLATGTRQVGGTAFEPDRRLSMTQLRAFVALVRAGSISAAAADLGLSQPAVHRAVRELEEALGRKLVERRGRGVHVNFAGRRFARSCRLALAELQAAFSQLGRDPHNPTIALGTTPLARGFLVPEAMALMVAERFPAGFRVHEGSWGELVEALRDGVIDIIVGEIPDDAAPDLATHPLYEEAPVVVAGRQHPLATRRSCTPQMLASYPWIIAPENSPLRAEWERLFADRRPEAPVECGSIMIIGRLLTASDLLTLAMPDQVALQVRTGLLSCIGAPLAGSRPTVGATMRKSWRLTRAQQRFLELLTVASAGIGADASRQSLIEPYWT